MILLIKDERKLDFISTRYPPIFLNDAKLLFEICSCLLFCEKCITDISNFQLMSKVFQQFSTMSGVGLPTFTEAN